MEILLLILCTIVPLLISVAYFTLVERKILGAIQRRKGPNVVGAYGLLQPLSDGFKLLIKETVVPSSANRALFILSPVLTFVVSLMGWGVIPFSKYGFFAQLDTSLIYLFAFSSLGVYGIIFSGWSSNSKYAFLGALRSTAQMVSYEISLGFIIIVLVMFSGSLDIQTVIYMQSDVWLSLVLTPLLLVFVVSALAETNRHPFDLPEAEAELVSGYNVEYSAMGFALFSLGEYSNMLAMCALTTIFFFGGWLSPAYFLTFLPGSIFFAVKVCFFVILFAWARAALPRYRYDQLMDLGWNTFVPISLASTIVILLLMATYNMFSF